MMTRGLTQNLNHSTFTTEKRAIDRLTDSIDRKFLLLEKHLVGRCKLGQFEGDVYHTETNEILKVIYFFGTDTTNKNVFYYNNKQPIKLVSNGSCFYYIGEQVFDGSGKTIQEDKPKELIEFEFTFRQSTINLLFEL